MIVLLQSSVWAQHSMYAATGNRNERLEKKPSARTSSVAVDDGVTDEAELRLGYRVLQVVENAANPPRVDLEDGVGRVGAVDRHDALAAAAHERVGSYARRRRVMQVRDAANVDGILGGAAAAALVVEA